ncbi:MAG: PLP-dependent aminotransferase family protein [Sneathiella sp.]|nr:PLP-dependent aminotransferase family protein [Sneathiella sp.]
MTRRIKNAYLATLSLDPNSRDPLHRQLFMTLRDAILHGLIKPGTRLPSSRLLASDLNISRNTVLTAFDQLTAEGYISSRVGAGSYISDQLPEELLHLRKNETTSDSVPRDIPLSHLARNIQNIGGGGIYNLGSFSPGTPELDKFPFEDWARLLGRHWRHPKREYLVGNPIGGATILREALAEHLGQTRAVRCSAEQVIILSGSQQAIHLVIKAFAEKGDPIWMEEPGYPGTRNSILSAGATPVPVPVDEEGFRLSDAKKLAPDARLACISPSHQYPLGHTMSLPRRLDLLQWAKTENRFILEDDYDSEYRYTGRPLSSLQGLDTDNRVLYVGTMSKVMFSGLRMGYLVVPPDLVDVFLALRRDVDGHSPSVAEAALAEFISEGSLSAHIRRMRILYENRQNVLIKLLREKTADYLTVEPQESGMHLIAQLKPGIDDKEVEVLSRSHGMLLRALSGFYQFPKSDTNGLILGFAGTKEEKMPQLVDRLSDILETLSRRNGL